MGEGVESCEGLATFGSECVGRIQNRRNPPLLLDGGQKQGLGVGVLPIEAGNRCGSVQLREWQCLHPMEQPPEICRRRIGIDEVRRIDRPTRLRREVDLTEGPFAANDDRRSLGERHCVPADLAVGPINTEARPRTRRGRKRLAVPQFADITESDKGPGRLHASIAFRS